jgi:hypothetical protein
MLPLHQAKADYYIAILPRNMCSLKAQWLPKLPALIPFIKQAASCAHTAPIRVGDRHFQYRLPSSDFSFAKMCGGGVYPEMAMGPLSTDPLLVSQLEAGSRSRRLEQKRSKL